MAERWDVLVAPHAPNLQLRSTDVPTLRRRERDAVANRRAEIDFIARDGDDDDDAFGFELKTGKSYIGSAMASS